MEKAVLSLLILLIIFPPGWAIKFGDLVVQPLIHDRPQVFASVEFGGLKEQDLRHFMGVLINPMYIITAGPTLAK